jgi:hypothetical protein
LTISREDHCGEVPPLASPLLSQPTRLRSVRGEPVYRARTESKFVPTLAVLMVSWPDWVGVRRYHTLFR